MLCDAMAVVPSSPCGEIGVNFDLLVYLSVQAGKQLELQAQVVEPVSSQFHRSAATLQITAL